MTDRYVFTHGHMFSGPNQAVIGSDLAAKLHLRVGGTLTVARRHFQVTGIYHIGVAEQDEGAVIPLAAAQAISGKTGRGDDDRRQPLLDHEPRRPPATHHPRFPGCW